MRFMQTYDMASIFAMTKSNSRPVALLLFETQRYQGSPQLGPSQILWEARQLFELLL